MQSVLHLQVAIKEISHRLDDYAHHDWPDNKILGLLQDTRTQILSLRLARQKLKKSKPKKRSGFTS